MSEEACPFKPGTRYRVRANVSELGHSFCAGEVVTFTRWSYDAHNGVSRFWFVREGANVAEAWHVWDDEASAALQSGEYFEECLS